MRDLYRSRRGNPWAVVYDPPPIPLRQFDWAAFPEEHDEDSPVCYGRTRAEALEAVEIHEEEAEDE